ncbi:hypothetical protein AVDCRST_MAG94-1884 [uncultured Leptolyngbya sp.]|uniref:Uncharacterized protein n=1 Tax=uncultured Leptolyngbya sp. TaxID=332963 RepID=A0A6J4LEU9_9CYAN|nr:hypothetical protein AVDCRST_MAG94-1884 [uncultured Leptolyngbya sp.]
MASSEVLELRLERAIAALTCSSWCHLSSTIESPRSFGGSVVR